MFFSTSPLPFCRQLINNKQSGDIEVSFTNKVGKIKKDIKSSSDKEKIEELELKLAILIAKQNQATEGGKSVSDADLKRAKGSLNPSKDFPMYSVPDDFDGYMNEETMAELRAGASQRDLEQGISRIKGNKNYKPLKSKKGGGKIYASMNKKYGGGIYPRKPTNG